MSYYKITKNTLIKFKYMYDERDIGDEELWFFENEGLGEGIITKDNGDTVDIKLSNGKAIIGLPKDSFVLQEG